MRRKGAAFLMAFFLLTTAFPARAADDMCGIAVEALKRGTAAFADDRAAGLKLFIKARQLCPDDPLYAYNLGVAYYRYGRADEAAKYLGQAVTANGSRPRWRNNYAAALLDSGRAGDALKQAEAAAAADGANPEIADTLARSRAAAGKTVSALKGLREFAAKHKWNRRLEKRYAVILDRAMSHALEMVKQGGVDRGLAALSRLDFDPKAVRARIMVMAAGGRASEALAVAALARKRFSDDPGIKEAFDDAAGRVAASLYRRFRQGDAKKAVATARELAGKYPDAEPLRTASNKLLDALLSDTASIEVPAAVARADTDAGTTGRADSLLAALAAPSVAVADVDLKIDVEENIPRGEKAGPYDVAVVIGNRRYRAAGVPPVDYAERDAAIMRRYLVRTMGFDKKNIIKADNATLGTFNQIFGTGSNPRGRLYNFVKPGQSRVFIYYVGHGAPDLGSGDAYFVPVEADPQYLSTSGYRLATFYKNLDKLPARDITVVLDACFSGNSSRGLLFKGVSSIVIKPREVRDKPAKAVVVASARADQVSTWYPEKRHSLFTYYFLKGLQGKADTDHNHEITVGEMAAFLQDKVPYMARRLKGVEQQPTVSGSPDRVLARLR